MPIPNKESLQHRIQNHLAYKLGSLMIAYDKARQKNLKAYTNINTNTNIQSNTNINAAINSKFNTNTNINTNVNAKFNTNPSTTTPTQVALNSAGGGGIYPLKV